MRLFYTTPERFNSPQPYKEFSLGGAKSGSEIYGGLNSLFSDISEYTIEKNQPEYIGIVLWNLEGDVIDNIQLWFDFPVDANGNKTNYCDFQVSAVQLFEGRMDKIGNAGQTPPRVSFYSADGESNSVGLGTLYDNQGLGLWIKRSVIKSAISYKNNDDILYSLFMASAKNFDVSIDQTIYAEVNEPVPVQVASVTPTEIIYEEDVTMNITWTSTYYGGAIGYENFK